MRGDEELKKNDIYTHYKGVDYEYIGVTVPISTVTKTALVAPRTYMSAYHTDLYETGAINETFEVIKEGNLLITKDVRINRPHVLYISKETGLVWLREYTEFHEYIEVGEQKVKRFQKKWQ